MDWAGRNPKALVVVSALVVACAVMGVWGLSGRSGSPSSEPTLGLATPTATPSRPLRIPTAPPSAEVTPAPGAPGVPAGPATVGNALMDQPGLPGGSLYANIPKHHVELSVTSAAPIGTVGYIVPTSLHESHGIDRNVGTSWSLSTIAYGRPDYARIWVQAGPRGEPVTCTITVDGRVTAHHSTDGPYGQMMCQG